MKTTNYAKIAEKYDKNQYRVNEIRFDQDLKEHIEGCHQTEYTVLDLSCGTGLYLEKQMNYFKEYQINWHGLDASEDMLKKAKERTVNAALVQALAENMPYSADTFDFIANNYAFHHYRNKGQALNEVYRVLKKGGLYKLHNIAIHDMPKWWIYHYFPAAYKEDLERFWEKAAIFSELTTRGFKVSLKIEYRMEENKVADYLAHAENRDISVLSLLNDTDYFEGLERMRRDVKTNPDKKVVTDFAELFCIAQKI